MHQIKPRYKMNWSIFHFVELPCNLTNRLSSWLFFNRSTCHWPIWSFVWKVWTLYLETEWNIIGIRDLPGAFYCTKIFTPWWSWGVDQDKNEDLAVWYSMLQFVTICYSLLQFATVCYSLLQFFAVWYSLWQFVIVCYSFLWWQERLRKRWGCHSLLQFVTVCDSLL